MWTWASTAPPGREMGEMGWAGVIVPEAHGGSEFGYRSLGLVLEETGRTLTNSPLLSTALIGASALTLGGTEAQKAAWLPRIAAAEAVIALALEETRPPRPGAHGADGGQARRAASRSTARRPSCSTGWRRTPSSSPPAPRARRATRRGSPSSSSPRTPPGVSRTRLETIDSRGAAEVTFTGVQVGADAVLGQVDGGFASWTGARPRPRRARRRRCWARRPRRSRPRSNT